MNIKRLLSIIFALALILCSALPAAALGQPVIQNNDYLPKDGVLIGWNGCAVLTAANGSFTYNEGGATVSVSFGLGDGAVASSEAFPYPVSTHKYSADGVGYTVEQFALGDESGAVCIYSRFTVYNSTAETITFPSVTGTVPVSDVPLSVEANKTAYCDYIVSVKAPSNISPASLRNETFESAKEKMIANWDNHLAASLSVSGLAQGFEGTVDDYRHMMIADAICNSSSAVSAIANGSFPNGPYDPQCTAYSCAVALMRTGDTGSALSLFADIKTDAEQITFEEGALPYSSVSKNLNALLTLQSYAYIARVLYPGEAVAIESAERALSLSESIAAFIDGTDAAIPADWEAYTLQGDYSSDDYFMGIDSSIFNSEGFATAAALCDWYVKSSVFTSGVSKDLCRLAKDANSYYKTTSEPTALLLSMLLQREDGTVIIGKGAPLGLISENTSFTLKNIKLNSGQTATLTVKAGKNTVDITLSGASAVPFQIEFPLFEGNIEYASVGFDGNSGIVTAPAGTSFVSVRLTENISDTVGEADAAANLEKVIAGAYALSVDDPTTVSKELYDVALERAEKARDATKDEKLTAANELKVASASLSPMVSGYTHALPYGNEYAGTVTNTEIYQKFSLPSSGTVSSLFVKGEYADGISAAVYTLRGDAYTTDELRDETYGERAEGGIVFDLDFEAVADTVYVLCIFSEDGPVSLYLERSDKDTAHTVNGGTVSLCTGASLALTFEVTQVNRKGLDGFYSTCLTTNTTGFTKESRNNLTSRMNSAKKLLCTPSVTEEEDEKVYDDLKNAYDGLDTYASEDKIEGTPVVGLVLIAIVVILLVATFFSAMAARKKMDPYS
ncbi:MAG: hypothetical protein IJD22_04065 [Clostridia bacterium]|nr:hypothetical protein [Clostridia bacterium]